jgi:hypothetical protein
MQDNRASRVKDISVVSRANTVLKVTAEAGVQGNNSTIIPTTNITLAQTHHPNDLKT